MADQQIDTANTPFVSVPCVGDCRTWVVAVAEHADMAMCLECRRDREKIDWVWFEPFGEWHPTLGYPSPGSGGRIPDPQNPDLGMGKTEKRQKLTPFANIDAETVLRCLKCGEEWPQVEGLDDLGRVRSFAGHDRIVHGVGVWLVGPPGGADEMVCAPCGGGDREKRPLAGGPDHTKCLKGKGKGWSARCGCSHRSREELDQIAGKNDQNGRKWRPARWSDPEIVEIASENVKNRWNQLNLWGEGTS